MKHFLEISQLSLQDIHRLLERAEFFKKTKTQELPNYSSFTLANLFYENSTRTRVSFELAAKKLSISVINLDLNQSSERKGESIEDTFQTLVAMGINLFVIRHKQERIPETLSKLTNQAHIINAGDGNHAHPTQGMLDLMTILQHKSDLTQCKIAIVGDIRHSRVASSLQEVFRKMKVGELKLVAPKIWWPQSLSYGQLTTCLKDGIRDADVIICLRIQHERFLPHEKFNLQDYLTNYTITSSQLIYAKPDAIIMHPGPMNRGVEIDSTVADGPQSCILQQVENGVFMRMAVLEMLLQEELR